MHGLCNHTALYLLASFFNISCDSSLKTPRQLLETHFSRFVVELKYLDEYLKDAVAICTAYNKELCSLMQQYGLTSEGDIACGCLNTVMFTFCRTVLKNQNTDQSIVGLAKPWSFVCSGLHNEHTHWDLQVQEYPDWMEKPDKPCYISNTPWWD